MRGNLLWIIAANLMVIGCLTTKVDSKLEGMEDCDKLWEQADSLLSAGLPKSALDVTDQILARCSTGSDHWLRAFVYSHRIRSEFFESDLANVIESFESQLSILDLLGKYIAYSYLGELYDRYLQANFHSLSDRIEQQNASSIEDLSIDQLVERAQYYYLASVDKSLIEIDASEYDRILASKYTQRDSSISIYQILVERAISYLERNQSGTIKPYPSFPIADLAYLAPVKIFIAANLAHPDMSDPTFLAMQLYQKALKEVGRPHSLHLDLRRLLFVKGRTGEIADSTYEQTLQDMKLDYSSSQDRRMIDYYLASHYHSREEYRKAFDICSQILDEPLDSVFLADVMSLQEQIQRQEFEVAVEEVLIPGEEGLVRISYRNIDRLHYRIVRLQEGFGEAKDGEFWDHKNSPLVESGIWHLENDRDYKLHSTEFLIHGTGPGKFALLVSTHESFDFDSVGIAHVIFTRSSLAYSVHQYQDENYLQCYDRKTGRPLGDLLVFWHARQFDAAGRRTLFRKVGQGKTDKSGQLEVPQSRDRYFIPQLVRGADTLMMTGNPLNRRKWYKQGEHEQVSLYLDRSIYRPGQTLHFKGVVSARGASGESRILPSRKIDIILRDGNGMEIFKEEMQSNTFGAFYGHFVLPTGGLLGTMYLECRGVRGYKSFRVEAYQRPTFKITFDSISSSSLGAPVTATGVVTSFAGVPLKDVEVTCSVVREIRSRYYRSFSAPIHTPSLHIKTEVLKTDRQGRFQFNFSAIAADLSSHGDAICDYTVEAGVIDISGEFQRSKKTISIGLRPFGWRLSSPPLLDVSRGGRILLIAEDAQGDMVYPAAFVRIFKAEDTGSWRRTRYWQSDELAEHHLYRSIVERSYKLIDQRPLSVVVDQGLVYEVDTSVMNSGKYRLEVYTEDDQADVTKFDIELVNFNDGQVPTGELLYLYREAGRLSVGDTASVLLGSSVPGTVIHYHIEGADQFDTRTLVASGKWHEVRIPVDESKQGGFHVYAEMGFDNRYEQLHIGVPVVREGKELEIELETIRDIVEPGSEDTVNIKTNHRAHELAEICAVMYDASLDQILPHDWQVNFHTPYRSKYMGYGIGYGGVHRRGHGAALNHNFWYFKRRKLPDFDWFGLPLVGSPFGYLRREAEVMEASMDLTSMMVTKDEQQTSSDDDSSSAGEPTTRSDFAETLFFYPDLRTNEAGQVSFTYTMNDALTTWKMMILAHTKSLATGLKVSEIISQKELMITPNFPRFVRQGDRLTLSCKIDNLCDKDLNVEHKIVLIDAVNGDTLSTLLNSETAITARLDQGKSTAMSWNVLIPADQTNPIRYIISARAQAHQDVVMGVLSVMANDVFLTSTRALELKGMSKSILDLKESFGKVEPEIFRMDVTADPSWYAIQALPKLMDYPHECTDQIFNRLYGAIIGKQLKDQKPQIEELLDNWIRNDLKSPLSSDPSLKSAVLYETPWLREAMDETQSMRSLGLYFDTNSQRHSQLNAIRSLSERQNTDGGYPWFIGNSNLYITQYISMGLIRLLEHLEEGQEQQVRAMLTRAVKYLDENSQERYNSVGREVERGRTTWDEDHLRPLDLNYLWIRSHYDEDLDHEMEKIMKWYLIQGEKYWMKKPFSMQALLIDIFKLKDSDPFVSKIFRSLRERIITDDPMGAHLPYSKSWHWYDAPIESQSQLIKVFERYSSDLVLVRELKRWLLNHRRTNGWHSNRATLAAISALLGQSDSEQVVREVSVQTSPPDVLVKGNVELGTLHTTYHLPKEKPLPNNIVLKNTNENSSWVGLYLQHFKPLGEVSAEGDSTLHVSRKILKVVVESGREKLVEANQVELGDKLVVQIKIGVERDMEYMHLKDLHPAGLEPLETLSEYNTSGGLGSYRVHTDVATNFYIDRLPAGEYILQYHMLSNTRGEMAAGYSSLQCLYAPEYAGHSAGGTIIIN